MAKRRGLGFIFHSFGDKRTDGDGREEPDPSHALADRRYELHGELVGNLVEPERIQGALARAKRIVSCQKWEGRCRRHNYSQGVYECMFSLLIRVYRIFCKYFSHC